MSEALVKRGFMGLERPAFIKEGDVRGTENITTNDIKFPALRLAQAMSPEVKRSEAAYIKDLREGELFNSITKEIYGEEPVTIVIVNQLGHRNIEFDPNDRNVVLDGNVPDGDPRTDFTYQMIDGVNTRIKPKATKFYDYLVFLLHDERDYEVLTLSLKSTQLKKATELNTLLKTSKMPTFAFVFEATPVPEKKKNNSFYGWKFTPKGYVTEDIYKEASDLFDSMSKSKANVVLETETETDVEKDEEIPF